VSGEDHTVPGDDAAARFAEIARESFDVWVEFGRSWQRRATSGETWTSEHDRDDAAFLVDRLAPLATSAADVWVELLRPWATAFQARREGGES
jgi:hypothetical protein